MDDVFLLDYFRRGLIPGPTESEEAFLQRVKKSPPLNHPEWNEVSLQVDWVPITYSNHKLAWWEGAATWISELPSIQLRKGFQKGSYLGYARADVLAHEAVHAARLKFEEPFFEEILAYSTAPQKWKRFFGPFFSRSWEPLLLLLTLITGGIYPLIPLTAITCWVGWLTWRQSIFKKCCRALSMPIVLCLTDAEIKMFAQKPETFKAYLETGSTPRFQLLRQLDRS